MAAWEQFGFLRPMKEGCSFKTLPDTRGVLTLKMVGDARNGKARLAAKVSQEPDMKECVADSSGCASLRASHRQAISSSALREGRSGPWISKMPHFRQVAAAGMCFFARQVNGTRRACVDFGKCVLLHAD